jgi:hypothetical protein
MNHMDFDRDPDSAQQYDAQSAAQVLAKFAQTREDRAGMGRIVMVFCPPHYP